MLSDVPGQPDGLTLAQREAVAHRGGPLVVLGGAGTGKTRALLARAASLIDDGVAPEAILVWSPAPGAPARLRAELEAAVEGPYEELSVFSPQAFCARLLRDEALEAGLDPFVEPVGTADRAALLLERIDELTLRVHEFRGDAAALVASFVRRIDRLKDELVSAQAYSEWAAGLPESDDAARSRAAREREFAEVYVAHDRMLRATGSLDAGDLLFETLRLLREKPHVCARVRARFTHVLVDDFQDATFAQSLLLHLLAGESGDVAAFADGDQAIARFRAAATKNVEDFRTAHPTVREVTLERSLRCPAAVLVAAGAALGKTGATQSGGDAVSFWRCTSERAQAQSVAGDIERLLRRDGVQPHDIAVLVRSVRGEGQAVAVALEERAVPHRIAGVGAFFLRPEVRDLLAWLRLLADPGDAGAVVRALARPPIELRSIDLARCTQIARRRKLDMVAALVAATESPQIPPEARERILTFLKLYRTAAGALDTMRPDLYVHRLVERLGLRRQQLFAAQADVVERLVNLSSFAEIASSYVRREPQATPREFARYVAAIAEAGMREDEADALARPGGAVQVMTMRAARGLEWRHVYVLGLHSARMPGSRRATLEPIPDALLSEHVPGDAASTHLARSRRLLNVAMTRTRERLVLAYPRTGEDGAERQPSPFVEAARAALGADWDDREEELFGPAETLHASYRALRDELLETIGRTGSRLGELRFDTDLDVSHAVVRYLEVLKVSALIDRAPEQGPAEALPEINQRLLGAVTAEQREILLSSPLDEQLLGAEQDAGRRAAALAAREEPSLEAFLPRRGDGLVLSASDIETYRTCPLKYKFARVFRIPQEPTLNQRFGILVHQVLERFHAAGERGGGSLPELHGLLDAAWRRGGFSDSEQERQLRQKAVAALNRYFERFQDEESEPVWFERSFSFRMGPHLLRGRVDRVDRLPDGGYELIDYKTGVPKSPGELKDDVQLSLYAVGAREAWELEAPRQSYYYVLDDAKVPVDRDEADREWITGTVHDVADGILAQGFEPTPSYSACSRCDYRIVCPAAER
ncbi:MAG: ATP-dependent helicase UvrD/PcrA [Solirubrobacteraceae bacterium]|jgi:DNA helicase-2/ATP-dependent DNA helicase PcrA|nr:ATP-dependent helicase UvrD/PcrA [Solirubrobacteraceae bacterium]